jgi:uncharacterized membrane protein YgaE (UPF0421/DUF939 family)
MLTWSFDSERLAHSLKTAIACLVALALTKLLGFKTSPWIVITTIVVMCAQLYVGSVLNKAYLRFLGTLVGCLFAVATLATFGSTGVAIAFAICLSTFVFSYIATEQENYSYAASLGAVTTAIIMLGQQPTLTIAAERFFEIVIGIVIATLISQFILPIHARTHLRRAQALTLEQLRDYYIACMVTQRAYIDVQAFQELDEGIIKSLTKQRQLAKESVREHLAEAFHPEQFMQTLHNERELLRAIDFMRLASMGVTKSAALFQSAALVAFNESTVQALNTLITALQSEEGKPRGEISLPCVQTLKQGLDQITIKTDKEDAMYLDGFVFAAEVVATSLKNLGQLLI